jgi:hypothetical protein
VNNGGAQWKRAVAFYADCGSDYFATTRTRRLCEDGGTACSGMFNTRLNESSPCLGSPHAVGPQYLFNTRSYTAMSELISRVWASFVIGLDPNNHEGVWRKI